MLMLDMAGIIFWLVVFRHLSEKYEFVSWDFFDPYPQDMEKQNNVPNYQQYCSTVFFLGCVELTDIVTYMCIYIYI